MDIRPDSTADVRPDSTDVAGEETAADVILAQLVRFEQDADSSAAPEFDPRQVALRCEDRAEESHFDEDVRPDSTDVAGEDAVANVITGGLMRLEQDADSNSATPDLGSRRVASQVEDVRLAAKNMAVEEAVRSVIAARPMRFEHDPDSKGPPELVPGQVILRCEDRAEEWHFDEAIHRSRLLEYRELSRGFAQREQQAKERLQQHMQHHDNCIAEIFKSAEAEERLYALELAGLREQVIEVQYQALEAEEDCELQVKACEQEIFGEQQKRAEMERELEKEKQIVKEATQHINAMEERESELTRLKRDHMAGDRAFCKRQMLELQRNGDLEIREMNKVMREEIDEIQRMIDKNMLETQRGVDAWVHRRRDVTAASDRDIIETVDAKVHQGLSSVHMNALVTRGASLRQIKEIQASDFDHEALLRGTINDAMVSVGCSLQEKEQARTLEKAHKVQLKAAIDVLGCTLPNNRYALGENQRLRSALSYVGGTD